MSFFQCGPMYCGTLAYRGTPHGGQSGRRPVRNAIFSKGVIHKMACRSIHLGTDEDALEHQVGLIGGNDDVNHFFSALMAKTEDAQALLPHAGSVGVEDGGALGAGLWAASATRSASRAGRRR